MNASERSMDLAIAVHGLIQEHDAMPRFGEMLLRWADEGNAAWEKNRRWQDRRDKHIKKSQTEARWRQQSPGPPKEGCVWESSGLDGTGQELWFPSDLAVAEEPRIGFLLPPTRSQNWNLAKKYAALAAVHDYCQPLTKDIGSQVWPSRKTRHGTKFIQAQLKKAFYDVEVYRVQDLITRQVQLLSGFIADVRKDLTKWKQASLRRRHKGELSQQVDNYLKSESQNKTAPEVAEHLNKTYPDLRRTSARAVRGTEAWKCWSRARNKTRRKK